MEADSEESADVTGSAPMLDEHLNLQASLSIAEIDESCSSIFRRSIEDDEWCYSIVTTALGETSVGHTLNLVEFLFGKEG